MTETITDNMREKWKKQLSFLLKNQEYLNDLEIGFIDSISTIKDLSIKQSFKLGQIYAKALALR